MTGRAALARSDDGCDRTAAAGGCGGRHGGAGGLRSAGCLRSVLTCRRGATAIEYGLVAALVAVAISGAVVALGVDLRNLFVGARSEIGDGASGDATTETPSAGGGTNGEFIIIRPGGNVNRQ